MVKTFFGSMGSFWKKIFFRTSEKFKITVCLFFIFSCFSAQVDKDLNFLLSEAQASQNPVNSIKLGFELLRKAKEANDEDKIKYALFFIGDGYYGLGDYSKAMLYCNMLDAETGSDKYFSKIRAARVKSFLYLDFGMKDKSVAENNKAFAMVSKFKNKNTDDYHNILGVLWRDKSTYYTDNDSILKYDRKNLDEFLKLKEKYIGSSNLSMPYNNVGYDYLLKGKLDSALYHYKKAEYYAIDAKDEFNFAFVCQSYGEYFDAIGKPDSAIAYHKKSLKIAQKFKEYKLAKAATDYLRELYLKKGDKENSIKYDHLFFSLNDSINEVKKRELNEVVTIIEKEKDLELKKSNTKKYWIIGLLLFSALLITIYAIYQHFKNKRDYIKFTKIIEGLENKSSFEMDGQIIESESTQKLSTSNISDEKEHELMKKLNNFEKKEQFLYPEISLSSMASTFNTNVNYLSKVIKKYRNNNFNTYINELRINYITKKIRSNPEYLNYKIAYLAEECGYTSYSSFVSIFKQQTGLTPSKFIEYLSKE